MQQSIVLRNKKNRKHSNIQIVGKRRRRRNAYTGYPTDYIFSPSRFRSKRANDNHHTYMTNPGQVVPDLYSCVLRYEDTTTSRSAPAASNVMNWSYRSSAFDPDPIIGTGAISGFAELAALYFSYRVTKMVSHIEVNNQETSGVITCGWPGLIAHNANTITASDLLEFSGGPGGVKHMLGNTTGMSRNAYTITADLMKLVGPDGFTNIEYTGATNSNPTFMMYNNFGAVNCLTVFGFAQPVLTSTKYYVTFFERKQLQA